MFQRVKCGYYLRMKRVKCGGADVENQYRFVCCPIRPEWSPVLTVMLLYDTERDYD